MPLASIIIPTYNSEKFIESAIKSAQQQTVRDIEIIVSDNASTDQTINIAHDMSKLDQRIRVFQNQKNMGPVANWKTGISKATSTYSKLLFSDDLLHPEFLQSTLPSLLDPNCSMAISPAVIGHEQWVGNTYYNIFLNDTKIRKSQFLYITTQIDHITPVSPCAMMCRTVDLLNGMHNNIDGFESSAYEETGAGVDWLLFPLIALKYDYVHYLAEPKVFFLAHDSNLSNNPKIQQCYSNAKIFIKKNLLRNVT